MLLMLGILSTAPVSAYDHDEEEQETQKSSRKKKSKKKAWNNDDYWNESDWEDDEVKPVTRKKKSRKKARKEKKSAKEDEDSWDNADFWEDDDSDWQTPAAKTEKADPPPARQMPVKTALGRSLGSAPAASNTTAPARQEEKKPDPRMVCVQKLASGAPDIEITELNIVHPQWRNSVRFNKGQKVLVNMNQWREVATVLEFTERELCVKWDNWGAERFLRQPDNTYMLDSMVKVNDNALSRKITRVAARLRGPRAVAWEDYGWTGKLMDFISGNDAPLTYRTFRLKGGAVSSNARFSEDEMVLVRMSPDHEAAKVLAYTGVKLHVHWQSGAVESYKRTESGDYRKIDDALVARQLLDPVKSTREKTEDDWFQIWWRDVMNEEKPLSFVNVGIEKGGEEYKPRLSKDNLVLIQTPPHKGWAKVIKFNSQHLILRWDGVREELYERGDDNVYHFVR